MGFAWVSIGHHWVSHPTVWPQPFPMLARLAPETGSMRLKTSVLLLPILNAGGDVAENVATLDHITHGRLDVGVAIGYRERELEAAGLARKDRVPKLEESIAVMKRLWSGEEVTFEGALHPASRARGWASRPTRLPHPPLEMGAQSVGATRRAARLVDAVFFGPQVAWADIGRLVGVYREARAERTRAGHRDRLAQPHRRRRARRRRTPRRARYLERTFTMYRDVGDAGAEHGPAPARLRHEPRRLDDQRHARGLLETIARAHELGLDGIGFTIYSLPREVRARASSTSR